MVRLSKLCLLVCLLGVVGCPRQGPPPAAFTVAYAGLKTGAYDATDDLDPATPGLQVAIRAQGIDGNGGAVVLASATLTVASATTPRTTRTYSHAELTGDTARFAPVTLPDGASTLTVTLSTDETPPRKQSLAATVTASDPPVVSVRFVQDANQDGQLNLAELTANPVVVEVHALQVADEAVAEAVDAADPSVVFGSGSIAANTSTFALSQLVLAAQEERLVHLVVRVTDGARSASVASDIFIDTTPPALTVLAPLSGSAGIAADADPTAAGYQLRFAAQTSADVASLSVVRGPGDTVDAPVDAPTLIASFDTDVDAPAGTTVSFAATATDLAGNVTTATATTYVKTAPPAVDTFEFEHDTSPRDFILSLAEQSSGDVIARISTVDLEPDQQVEVRDANAPSVLYGAAPVLADGTAAVDLTGIDPSVDASYELVVALVDRAGNANAPTDVNTRRTLRVARVAPALALIWPCVGGASPCPSTAVVGIADDLDPGAPGLQLGLQLQVPASVTSVTFTEQAGSVSPGHAETVPVSGGFATTSAGFLPSPVTTASARYLVQATATDSAGNPAVPLDLDFTLPAFFSTATATGGCPNGCTTADLLGAGSLSFVAQSNSHFFPTPAAGYLADLDPGTASAEASFTFTVAGAQGAMVQMEYQGAPIGTAQGPAADNAPHAYSFSNTALPTGTSGSLGIRITGGGSGELVAYTVPAQVDVVPPAQTVSSVSLITPSTGSPFDPRRPSLEVQWTASGDDGTSGAVAGYDVRWSTDAVLPPVDSAGSGTPVWAYTGIDSDLEFFNSGPTPTTETAPGSPLPPGTLSVQIPAVPALGRYFAVVRGFDAVGNYAPLPPVAQQTVGDALQTASLQSGVTGTNRFGGYLQAGDLDGDGRADLAILENFVSGNPRVFISKGAANPQAMTVAPLSVPASTLDGSAGFFITDLSIGSTSQPNDAATPVKDLVISGNGWDTNRGRAVLYFGGATAPGSTAGSFVEIRGTAAGDRVGGTVRIIPDLNGDHLDELLVPAWGQANRQGNVYLFFGRPAVGPGSWTALATALDGAEPYIPLSSADRVFAGPATGARLIEVSAQAGGATPVLSKAPGATPTVTVTTWGTSFTGGTVTVASADPAFASGTFAVLSASSTSFTYNDALAVAGPGAATNQAGAVTLTSSFNVGTTTVPANGIFGRGRGFAVLDDALVLPESMDFLNTLFLYPLAAIGTAPGGLGTVASSGSVQVAEALSPALPTGGMLGFGYDAVPLQFGGGATTDLAVAAPLANQVRVLVDPTSAGSAQTVVLSGRGRFGTQLGSADLDGDGRPDLGVATNNVASVSRLLTGAHLFFGGAQFDTRAGVGFRQARVLSDTASLGSLDAVGFSIAFGDFDGNGSPDVAVSDPLIGNPGAQSGKVFVRY